MKLFARKIAWFLLPVMLIHAFSLFLYRKDKGDLIRMAYIADVYPYYRDDIEGDSIGHVRYDLLSEARQGSTYDILTIGDSFSEQKGTGYINILAEKFRVLHVDRLLSGNQLTTLFGAINGDLLDRRDIRFIVLQNVERNFIRNAITVDTAYQFKAAMIDSILSLRKPDVSQEDQQSFSREVLKVPYSTVQYWLRDEYGFENKVLLRRLKSRYMFSTGSDRLLFYSDDLQNAGANSNRDRVAKLNALLNSASRKLARMGVILIVLPSPDKYSIYYDYIANKQMLPKPLFGQILDGMPKDYAYVNAHHLLKSALRDQRDIYFYDDTHWAPPASRIVAHEILRLIASNETDKAPPIQ